MYEYTVFSDRYLTPFKKSPGLVARLKMMPSDGWELVSAYATNPAHAGFDAVSEHITIWRRPK